MTEGAITRRSGARGTGTAAALLLLGAALVAGSAFAPWGRRDYRDALTGPLTVTVTGGDVLPALVPVSLVILAAWAAAAMSRGALRRVLACCAALAAIGIVIATQVVAWRVPGEEFARQLRRPAEELGAPQTVIWGVLLAGLGGLLAAVGGILLAVTRTAARSARGAYDAHDAPAARREAAEREAQGRARGERPGSAPVSAEVAAEQLWRSLDVGVDPTDDLAGDTAGDDADGTAGGTTGGAVTEAEAPRPGGPDGGLTA